MLHVAIHLPQVRSFFMVRVLDVGGYPWRNDFSPLNIFSPSSPPIPFMTHDYYMHLSHILRFRYSLEGKTDRFNFSLGKTHKSIFSCKVSFGRLGGGGKGVAGECYKNQ